MSHIHYNCDLNLNAQVAFDRNTTPAGENELRCIGAAIWTSDTSATGELAS